MTDTLIKAATEQLAGLLDSLTLVAAELAAMNTALKEFNMSRAVGLVRIAENDIRFIEYNGTCDEVTSYVHDTKEELYAAWRSGRHVSECTCGAAAVHEAYTTYGRGAYFKVECCPKCRYVRALWDHMEERPVAPTWAGEFLQQKGFTSAQQ